MENISVVETLETIFSVIGNIGIYSWASTLTPVPSKQDGAVKKEKEKSL